MDYLNVYRLNNSSQAAGLHFDDSSFQRKSETHKFLSTLSTIPVTESDGPVMTNLFQEIKLDPNIEEVVKNTVKSIQRKVLVTLDNVTPSTSTFEVVGGVMNPLGAYLMDEISKFNLLLSTISSSLLQVMNGIDKYFPLNDDMYDVYQSISINQIPQSWLSVCYPSKKSLNSFIEDLSLRIQFISKWISEGPQPVYNISYLFSPKRFFTAMKQTYARKFKIPMDSLIMECEVSPHDYDGIITPPVNGCYIFGLYMQGGRYNRESYFIEETEPKNLSTSIPSILLRYSSPNYSQGLETTLFENPKYVCPVYKTSVRSPLIAPSSYLKTIGHDENFITELSLPIRNRDQISLLIRHGCALLCSVDD